MSPRLFRTLSDERLGSRLALGEAAAFDELYRRYAHRLAAYATHLLGDQASGDDVAQIALMRAYQSLRSGRAAISLRPWLYRIAHNAAIDTIRSKHELPTALVPEQTAPRGDAASAGALLTAIASLPLQQRRVYVLRELHGLRIDETAAEVGLSQQQVEQTLFAARNRLAEQLVFGERLNCPAVRRLADGPLDLRERRALKTHLRSCPSCRGELGARGIALTVLPQPSIDWLRGLFGASGAPLAVKVSAVVATATLAAGIPLVAETHPHLRRPQALTLGPLQSGPDTLLPLNRPPQQLAIQAAPPARPDTHPTRTRNRRLLNPDTAITTSHDGRSTTHERQQSDHQGGEPAAPTTINIAAGDSNTAASPTDTTTTSTQQQQTNQNTTSLSDGGTDSSNGTSGDTSSDGNATPQEATTTSSDSNATTQTPTTSGGLDGLSTTTSTDTTSDGNTNTASPPPSTTTTSEGGSSGSTSGSSIDGTTADGGSSTGSGVSGSN